MKCPECQSELVKAKGGYMCLHCGYAGKGTAGQASIAAVETKPEPIKVKAVTDSIKPEPAKPKVTPAPANSAPKPGEELSLDDIHEQLKAADHTAPIHQKTFGRPRPVRTITLVTVIILIVITLLAAYLLPARAAVKAFQSKFTGLDSVHLTGGLDLKASSFLSIINSNLAFDGVYAGKGSNDALNYHGTFASRDYQGSFIANRGQLYSQMTGSDLPFIRYNQGIATYHLLPSQWYQTKADQEIYKYYCETKPDSNYPQALVWYQAIRQIKLQPSPLVSYRQSVDGHKTTHLRGRINSGSLSAAWDNINSSLPNGCQIELLVSDLDSLDINYDLWTSPSYDQIQIHIADKSLGLSGTIKLVLDQYNQATAPTLPTGTINLGDVFSGRAAIQARDYTRRANIDALKLALDAYAKANKATPPSSLSKLVPKYSASVLKDPSGSEYKYTVSKKSYTLSATLEDAGQLYTVSGP